MDANLQELFKGLLSTLALIGGGFYLKVAKDKEPYASKTSWKTIIVVGIIGFILSLVRYLTKA